MSFLDKFMGKKKPSEDDLVGTWYMVADRIRNATVMLCGRDSAFIIEEAVFCTLIIGATSAGWFSGRKYFDMLDDDNGALKIISNGMSIVGDDAKEFIRCLHKWSEILNDGNIDFGHHSKQLDQLCMNGGFRVI